MARKEGAPEPIQPENSIWNNSLTYLTPLCKQENPKSPFPREYTDEELSEWLGQLNQEFQEQLVRETLDKL